MPSRHRWILIAFVVWTLTLLTATHWPGLAIHGPFTRTDLVVHGSVYLLWTLLFAFGPMRNRPVPLILVAGVLFAAFDESTQPLFRRDFDWLDLAADSLGVVVATLVFLWARRRASRPIGESPA